MKACTLRSLTLVVVLAIGAAACGADDEGPLADADHLDTAMVDEDAEGDLGAAVGGPDDAAGGGDCDLLPSTEVDHLLEGRFLEVSRSGQGGRGGGCVIALEPVDDVRVSNADVVVQVGPAEDAREWMELAAELPDSVEVDLAEGAVLQGTTLDVLLADERSLRVGASLLLFDPDTLDPAFEDGTAYTERIAERLVDLARTIIDERL